MFDLTFQTLYQRIFDRFCVTQWRVSFSFNDYLSSFDFID